MATIVNIHQAKTQLSRLLERVRQGEEIIVAKAGRPVAKLVPFGDKVAARAPGSARGRIEIADDFDAPLPDDLMRSFEE